MPLFLTKPQPAARSAVNPTMPTSSNRERALDFARERSSAGRAPVEGGSIDGAESSEGSPGLLSKILSPLTVLNP
jgi:hypothetical protein